VHARLRALPNAITVMRLAVAIAFFVVVERLPREPEELTGWIAVGLFAFAAATDVVDGYLARRWDAVTPFGRVMDPFVDKVLVIGGLILLAGGDLAPRSGIATWMAILVLGRELLVTSVRAVVESSGGAFPADWAGKLKMLLQSLAIPVALGVAAIPSIGASQFWNGLSGFLTWAMLAATVGSALPYIWRAGHMLRPAPRGAR
jgi:CDP-diacylglycerol--glycerol-3-phosphate 3-phosphatidyltransferase